MNFIRITVDTILIINLLILPGSIFLSTVSRWAFPRSRVLQKRLPFFIFSILTSLLITVSFDRPIIKEKINKNIINSSILKSHTSEKFKVFFIEKKILEETLNNLDPKQELNIYQRREAIYRLVASSFLLMIYTFFLSALLSTLTVFANFLVYQSGFNVILNWIGYSITSITKLLFFTINTITEKFKTKEINKYISITLSKIGSIIGLLFALIILLGTPLYVSIALLLIISILTYELLFLILFKIFSLFRHPLHQTFYSFRTRFFLPIIEIRTNDNSLFKGKLVSYEPKNENEIYSISLTNVIQYKPSKETETFERGKRSMYEFETSHSVFTILETEIRDFNIWYLDYSTQSWKFNIKTNEDITNQLWYLKLLISNNKLGFDTSCLNITCIDKLSYKLIKEIINIINNEYSSILYKEKTNIE